MDARRLIASFDFGFIARTFADFSLRLVVLLGVDDLFGDQQMAFDEVRIRRHRLFEFGCRSFRLAQHQSSGHAETRFRHIRIDLQRILITRDGFRLVVLSASSSPQVTKASALGGFVCVTIFNRSFASWKLSVAHIERATQTRSLGVRIALFR